MCITSPNKRRGISSAPEAGFALVTAIFMLVVLSALAVYLVTFSTTGQVSSAIDVQETQAWRAARAGIEYARKRLPATCDPWSAPLDGFTMSVSCTPTFSYGGTVIYLVTSTAIAGNEVQRQLRALIDESGNVVFLQEDF